jgi:hypothetical protein
MKNTIITTAILLCIFANFSFRETSISNPETKNTIGQTNQIQKYNYTSFSILKGGDFGDVMPTSSTVIINNTQKKIVITKADKSTETYFIKSGRENRVSSSGNSYFAYIATDNNYDYYFIFFQNKFIMTNTITKNGVVLYR